MIARTCGPCTACCTAAPVEPLNKPAGARCRHQCAGGCAIYAERPKPCATYRCAWLEGEGAEDERPDIAGVVVELARRLDGSPSLATITALPGMRYALLPAARQWVARGVAALTRDGVMATPAMEEELRHVQLRFADGEVVEFRTEARP